MSIRARLPVPVARVGGRQKRHKEITLPFFSQRRMTPFKAAIRPVRAQLRSALTSASPARVSVYFSEVLNEQFRQRGGFLPLFGDA